MKKSSKKSDQKTSWGRVALVWVTVIGGIFFFIPRDKLPNIIKDQKIIVKAYDFKDGSGKNAANIEPAAGETGYKSDDRRELDSLISRGSYSQ